MVKPKILIQIFTLFAIVFLITGCSFFNFGQENGPGSGEEIDISEPEGPGSGEEIDLSEPEGPGSGEEIDTSEPTGPGSGEEEATGPGSGEEISGSDYYKEKAKGSCDAISPKSTCVEYIGSYWTWANIKLNCSGSGIPSQKPCPRPSLGGCNMGFATPNEIVTWHYEGGGGEITKESIPYLVMACNALSGSKWVY